MPSAMPRATVSRKLDARHAPRVTALRMLPGLDEHRRDVGEPQPAEVAAPIKAVVGDVVGVRLVGPAPEGRSQIDRQAM